MATNSLGSFTFITIDRIDGRGAPPRHFREQTQVIMRPGVDHVAVVLTGTRGVPFQMRSIVDQTSGDAAFQTLKDYEEMIGATKHRLIWNGRNFRTVDQMDFLVLDVDPLRIQKVSAISGGLTSSPTHILEVIWTLIAVPTGEAAEGS